MIRPSLCRRVLPLLLLALYAAPAAWSQAPDKKELPATFTVRVHPKAELSVDGQKTGQNGQETRRFNSPALEPGKTYVYKFVASWFPDNNYEEYIVTREVKFKAGDNVEVDLRKWDEKKGDVFKIRFLETPPEIVDAMLKLAKVGEDDVVYDLGCGDGRIVIAAVKKHNAKRGVGYDIDAEKILKADANAKDAGVAKKVEFRNEDVLKIKLDELSKATVVTLYMSDKFNEKLMPVLKQLKPGTRIVSHRFKMGDWKPDKEVRVEIQHDQEEEKHIFLWTITKGDKDHSGK